MHTITSIGFEIKMKKVVARQHLKAHLALRAATARSKRGQLAKKFSTLAQVLGVTKKDRRLEYVLKQAMLFIQEHTQG